MELADALRERLRSVQDPELHASIVELGMVGDITVSADGQARVAVALTTTSCPLRSEIERAVVEAGLSLEGIGEVTVTIGTLAPTAKAELLQTARRLAQARAPQTTVPRRAPVFMVASGKGGVGKSSVTANLAVTLAQRGARVGVLDADIWGFSLAHLLDLHGEIAVREGKMQPLTRPEGAGEIALLSMGHLAAEDEALLWRGLMVQKAVAQFIEDADWSFIDLLLIDTPPGTGDIAMTLSRLLPHLGVVVVTTPGVAAQRVAARAGDFAKKSHLRLLGVIENMSPVTCGCGERHTYFGEGGGAALAAALEVPLLASIPLDAAVSRGGDSGEPAARGLDHHFGPLADVITDLGHTLVPAGCTARLLDALDASLAASSTPA